jgi:hypothetical protein
MTPDQHRHLSGAGRATAAWVEDDLAPARGIALAALLSLPVWVFWLWWVL